MTSSGLSAIPKFIIISCILKQILFGSKNVQQPENNKMCVREKKEKKKIHMRNFLLTNCAHDHKCVCVCVCVVLPGLPGSRGAGCAGRWIVLLGCGGAVSLLLLRMDVGDRGQAYHCVTSQTTGCHAPQSMTRPPPHALKTASFSLTFAARVSDKSEQTNPHRGFQSV